MSKEIRVSHATYQKVLECHEILKNTSLNITIVDLALSYLREHKNPARGVEEK